jgi:hypothetical protein
VKACKGFLLLSYLHESTMNEKGSCGWG